jgi:hypothetical protein
MSAVGDGPRRLFDGFGLPEQLANKPTVAMCHSWDMDKPARDDTAH